MPSAPRPIVLLSALVLAGCAAGSSTPSKSVAPPPTVPAATAPTVQQPAAPTEAQTTFDSDDAAANAFLTAVAADDHDTVHKILGSHWKQLLSGDKVQDANAFKDFATHAAEHHQLEHKDATTTVLDVGSNNWPFPIPIVKAADGKWFFDTEAGEAEIRARTIGGDELGAIDVCHAYVRAQRQYFRTPHDNTDMLQYAQHILSSTGKEDGLYYPVANGGKDSPFGPLVADAEMEGYSAPGTSTEKHAPYHGYHFRILKSQGPAAPGGQFDYVINGHMVAGYALVAWPDKYGTSGVMTFIVNDRDKIYQKDLGPNTAEMASHMNDYNPDSTWTLVADQ